eukprot:4579269-Pleurochrysis_carterae.AAC.1
MCRPGGWWAGAKATSAVTGVALLRAQLASGDAPLRRARYICRSVASLSYSDRLWPSVGV